MVNEEPSEIKENSNKLNKLHYIYSMAVNEMIPPDNSSSQFLEELPTLDNRYGEKKLINSGGAKFIYKVFDSVTCRYVAMACLKQTDPPPKVQDFFLREAHLTASLEHPNIMPIYDISDSSNKNTFFTMKLTGGENLGRIIAKHSKDVGNWDIIDRLNLFLCVCEGIAYAHSKHIYHLDIKPDNIQVGEFGEVLICDWGLGKIDFEKLKGSNIYINPLLYNEMDDEHTFAGTPGYMAPEQIKLGSRGCSEATDIYALGGILYSLLTGKNPMSGETSEIIQKTLDGELVPPRLRSPKNNIPYALNAVVMKAMQKKCDDRYHTVSELINDITSFISGFATSAEEAGFFRNLFLLLSRHKVISTSLAVIASLFAIFVVRLRVSEQHAKELLRLYRTEKKSGILFKEQTVPKLLEIAQKALHIHDFKRAEQLINNALSINPNNPNALKMGAELNFYSQKFDASVKYFKKLNNPKISYMHRLAIELGQLKPDDQRLNREDFINLIKVLKNRQSVLLQLMHNERLNYKNIDDYLEEVKVLHEVINPQAKPIHFEYSHKNGELCVDMSGNEDMRLPKLELLQGLPINKLNLEGLAINYYDTQYLNNMELEEVNLVNSVSARLVFVNFQPHLKKIILSKDKYPNEQLDKLRERMTVILK